MDQLSVELISILFSLLTPTDVRHFRCASKFYANVGRPFMFSQLHLLFTPNSFERLHTISSNPTLARYVTSLYYEADSLPIYASFDIWKRCASKRLAIYPETEPLKPPPDGISERARRAYQRESTKLKIYATWDKYLCYIWQQKEMRKDNYLAGKIADAMANLPNLEEIIFSLGHWAGGPSEALQYAYSDAHVIPFGHNSHSLTEPLGVPQMLSLLQGSACTQMKVKRLSGGIMNWEFFKQNGKVLDDLHEAVRNLQELKLEFSTSNEEELERPRFVEHEQYHSRMAIQRCARYLTNGRLREFLSAAPDLRLLDIRFDRNVKNYNPGSPAALRYVLGKQKWDFLSDVTLGYFDSRAEDLIGFCAIHAMTLQRLVLNEIQLLEGSWLPTFQEMRRLLRLKQVRIRGDLHALEFHECWTFTTMDSRDEDMMTRVVQEYLLLGGDGPLLDLL